MKKSKIITLTFLFLCIFNVFSQAGTTIMVRGTVKDSMNKPIVYALITVLDSKSALIKQAITDEQGTFKTQIPKGVYTFLISSMGFKSSSKKLQVTKEDVVNIILEEDLETLNEVLITSKKHNRFPIKVEGSNITLNIQENELLKDVGTAIDVLKRTPGVFVNGQNNITIAGLKGTQVFINGKNTYVDAKSLASYLKSIPSKDIAKIEVMSSPPANYDSNGSGGIINIQLVKKGEKGTHFSIGNTVSYWKNLRHQANASLSYATDKWVLNTNYFHSIGHYSMAYGMDRWQKNNYISSTTTDTDKRKTISGKINTLWTPDEKNSVGFNLSINSLFGPGITDTKSDIYTFPAMNLEKKLVGKNDYFKQLANRYSAGIFYQLDIAENSFYRIDFDAINYIGNSKNNQPNTYYNNNGEILKDDFYTSQNDKDITIYSLSITNHQPVLGGKLDTGIKASTIHSDNNFEFSKVINKISNKDLSRSNNYSYNEINMHVFSQYSANLSKKYALQIGLRGEYTKIKGILKPNESSHKKDKKSKNDFFKIFPNVVLSYNSNNSKVEINYSKRIDRPKYENLNPFEYLLDELTYWKGNPFLEPQISNKISISYSKNTTACTFSYNHISNYMTAITDTFGTGNAVVMTTKNMGVKQQWVTNYIKNVEISKWWNLNFNLGIYYTILDLKYTDILTEKYNRISAGGSVQSSLKLPYDIHMNVNGRYYSKRPGGTYEIYPASGALDISLSKSIWNNHIKFTLLATDIFHSEIWDSYGNKSGLKIENWGYGESRQIKLSILYNLGISPKRKITKNKIDEIDRL